MLFPSTVPDWNVWSTKRGLEPFAEEVIGFLSLLSKSILKDPISRSFSDVVTFAFFCRKANLQKQKVKWNLQEMRLGRGIIFHIAPSNVPINFAYSFVAGLLSGNSNVVRVSSKVFPQVDLVVKHITSVAEKFPEICKRVVLVRYELVSRATELFSSFCDARVIWGEDATIAEIRRNPIPAHAFDVTFSDRYSFAAINADSILECADLPKLAEYFYNDTYLFDQNACTSPHLIVWLGKNEIVATAKKLFWHEVAEVVRKKYTHQTVLALGKLATFYRQSVTCDMKKEPVDDNRLWRTELKNLPKNIDEFRCIGGYFSEYNAKNLDEVFSIITSKYQTLAVYGIPAETLENFVLRNRPCGIDRIVPFNETTDFSLVWDGYDLIRTLSRVVRIL